MKRVLFVLSILMISMLACQMTGVPGLPQAQPTPVVRIDATAPVLPDACRSCRNGQHPGSALRAGPARCGFHSNSDTARALALYLTVMDMS